jgi:hypothetical protein
MLPSALLVFKGEAALGLATAAAGAGPNLVTQRCSLPRAPCHGRTAFGAQVSGLALQQLDARRRDWLARDGAVALGQSAPRASRST